MIFVRPTDPSPARNVRNKFPRKRSEEFTNLLSMAPYQAGKLEHELVQGRLAWPGHSKTLREGTAATCRGWKSAALEPNSCASFHRRRWPPPVFPTADRTFSSSTCRVESAKSLDVFAAKQPIQPRQGYERAVSSKSRSKHIPSSFMAVGGLPTNTSHGQSGPYQEWLRVRKDIVRLGNYVSVR